MWKDFDDHNLPIEEYTLVDAEQRRRDAPAKNGRTSGLCWNCNNPQIYIIQYLERGECYDDKCSMCGEVTRVYRDNNGWLFLNSKCKL